MTTPSPSSESQHSKSLLDFRSGGWVLLLAAVLAVSVIVWRVATVLKSGAVRAIGDGQNVATYGFDLSTCLVPRGQIVAAGISKDGIPALCRPAVMTATEADELNRRERGKYLVPDDRVIGVVIGGEARAYPLRILNWHEVVNDTLAGEPILVTYHPLCDSVVVFDRRAGGDTLEFGVSGLFYNSNLLMYDRRPGGQSESLWSQLQFRAIAGPAAEAGIELRVLPAALLRWADWRARHPDTTVLTPDPSRRKRYNSEPYATYFDAGRLRYPVDPMPPVYNSPAARRASSDCIARSTRRVQLLSCDSHTGVSWTRAR